MSKSEQQPDISQSSVLDDAVETPAADSAKTELEQLQAELAAIVARIDAIGDPAQLQAEAAAQFRTEYDSLTLFIEKAMKKRDGLRTDLKKVEKSCSETKERLRLLTRERERLVSHLSDLKCKAGAAICAP